jgi:hypothetical protein
MKKSEQQKEKMKIYEIDNFTFCWYNDTNELVVEDLNDEVENFGIITAFFEDIEEYRSSSEERDGYVFHFTQPIDVDVYIHQLSNVLDFICDIPDLPFITRLLFRSLNPEQQKELIDASKRPSSPHVPSAGAAEQSDIREEQHIRREPAKRKSTDSHDSVI